MVTVHGRASSSNVQIVLWALEEAGVAYERTDVGGKFGGNDAPEFREMNPNGLVPVVVEGGRVQWESHSIVRDIARRYGQGVLWPEDDAMAACADQWMDWNATAFWPTIKPVFFALYREPRDETTDERVAVGLEKIRKVAPILGAQLRRSTFVAGDQFTMGDIPAGISVNRFLNLELDLELPAE